MPDEGRDGGALPVRFHARSPADQFSVRALLAAAEARFVQQIGNDAAGTLQIVLAEVLNNVVEHAYREGHGEIRLSILRDGDALRCLVRDRGDPMPGDLIATAAPPEPPAIPGLPAAPAPAEIDALPEGGFGWPLIRLLTRDLGYARRGAWNLLSFRLPLD